MSDEQLARPAMIGAMIGAIEDARKELGCSILEVASACKAVCLCACEAMGVSAADVMGEEVEPDEALVVPEQDALD